MYLHDIHDFMYYMCFLAPSQRPVSSRVANNYNGSFTVEYTPTEVGKLDWIPDLMSIFIIKGNWFLFGTLKNVFMLCNVYQRLNI